MSPPTIGPLAVRQVGHGDVGGPAIVLCHGFGAPGDDLVELGRALDVVPGTRWFFPEAPLAIDFGGAAIGRAWWEVDLEAIAAAAERGQPRRLEEEDPPGLASARTLLEQTIAELEASHGVRRDRLLLGGFSQGAMLAAEVALHAEAPFAGLALLSGALLAKARWAPAARARGRSIRALVAHGRADPKLPFASGNALAELLKESGADVTWVPFDGGHELPSVVLFRLAKFANETLGAQ